MLQVLLGTFTCTAVPGEFVWMPGLLTKVCSVTNVLVNNKTIARLNYM